MQLLEIDSFPNLVKEGDYTASASVFVASPGPELRVYVCDVIWQQSPLGLIASSPIIYEGSTQNYHHRHQNSKTANNTIRFNYSALHEISLMSCWVFQSCSLCAETDY